MQVMTRKAILCLREFLIDPMKTPASMLVEIPALWAVMAKVTDEDEMRQLVGVCGWMYSRGRHVLDALLVHPRPGESLGDSEMAVEPPWKVVSGL